VADFDRLWVWDDPALAASLRWYRQVATNRRPAKFRIVVTIPVALDLAEASEAARWDELDRLTPVFLERWRAIRAGAEPLEPRPAGSSLLDLCAELARRMLGHCDFCRWN